ncbi:phage tail sheath family protein [Kitasatospora purpeofusca]|uniref:phage tail sheath family protein n=1 Tax=Kitasatospora purpeofusca TaxID=67352 RepID=UPI0036594562
MAVSAKHPGVYIEETFSLSLSIPSSQSAVTAFIGDFAGLPAGGVRVNNWLDFTTLADADGKGEVRQVLGPVLKGYFQNGGGPCYLVSTAGSTLAEGLDAVTAQGDVTILVAPGLWDQGAQHAGEWARALTGWAADHKAMAILHTDRDQTPEQAGAAVDAWDLDERSRPFAAVYYPWLRQSGEADPVAPSGAVAGAWTAVDRERGVWKAPANIALRGIDGPLHQATDTDQGTHINLNFIRTFTGAGTVIWGARTRSEADQWRYIPIRRLFSAIERDIQSALRLAVFESNSQPTWELVRAAVDSYLYSLRTQGALMGSTTQEAYFVQVGKGVTMTEDDIAAGRLVLKVGLAALRPAEFTILQFTQEMDQA